MLNLLQDLLGVDRSTVAPSPAFQEYFRTRKPRLLATWGKNDPCFLPAAEAFKRDVPDAKIQFFDTCHFAIGTHAKEMAGSICEFFARD